MDFNRENKCLTNLESEDIRIEKSVIFCYEPRVNMQHLFST